MGDEAAAHRAPVRPQLHGRDGEHEHAQAAVAEHALDPLERRDPDDDRERDHGEEEQPAVGEPGEQLQRDGDAADLGREREQVHDLGSDERAEARLEPDPLADRVEHRLAGDRGDAPAHLGVDDDPGHADRNHPQQLVAERRARGDVEDEVADVDEAADRGEDPEREPEDLVHAQPADLREPPLDALGRRAPLRVVVELTRARAAMRAASRAFARTRGSMPATVSREPSASAKLDAWTRRTFAWTRVNRCVVPPEVTWCASRAPSHAIESSVAESFSSACRSTVPPLQPVRKRAAPSDTAAEAIRIRIGR